MNTLDKQYTDLLQDIIDNGVTKQDRTGTGTISVFGRQIRHKMSEGFPLLTTKKMPFKTITTELLWFLRGDTNIKYLIDNGCNIWTGDAYKNWKSNGRDFWEEQVDGMFTSELGEEEVDKISKEWFINKIKTDDEFAKKWGDLGPVYGKQWRAFGGYDKVPSGWNHGSITSFKDVSKCDQLENLINDIKTNPDSRRLMVTAWNPCELDSMVLPPCHYGFQVYTRELSFDERRTLVMEGTEYPFVRSSTNWTEDEIKEGKRQLEEANIPSRAISLMWNQRSVDTFLGLPFNIASYGLLLEIIAKEVNMVPDELIGNLGDTHLYLNHIEQAKEQIGRKFTEEEIQEHLMQSGMDALMIDARARYIGNLPKKTREPYPLPTLMICGDMRRTDGFIVPFDELDHSLIKLIDYQSHPTIKAPLSN